MENITHNTGSALLQATEIDPLANISKRSPYLFVGSQPHSFFRDKISISDEGKKLSRESMNIHPTDLKGSSLSGSVYINQKLTPEKLEEIQELEKRDSEVRSHENAHKSVAGSFASGGPSYTYDIGPNGKRYAIGGEVPIDISKETTPEATLQKMQIITRAALAPANPSAADRKIAAHASMLAAQARRELQTVAPDESDIITNGNDKDPAINQASSITSHSSEESTQSKSISAIISRQMILNAYRYQSI